MKQTRKKGWRDIKWGVGDEVALAACKLDGTIGQLARYREWGEIPADGFDVGRYKRKRVLATLAWYTGMVKRTDVRVFWYNPPDGRITAEELGIPQEVWLNIFTDYAVEPRLWHPLVWVTYVGYRVCKWVRRPYVRVLEWLFERAQEGFFKED
jgi:hypothetical protein